MSSPVTCNFNSEFSNFKNSTAKSDFLHDQFNKFSLHKLNQIGDCKFTRTNNMQYVNMQY